MILLKNDLSVPARLARNFFAGTDVVKTAQLLLGKVICTRIDGRYTSGIIVETEAYRAPEDKASHAFNNRRTARTEVMFGEPGCAYVYLCYGIHHLFNVVSGPPNTAHAILIRAIQPLSGRDHMMNRRKMHASTYKLTAGPGTLSSALGIRVNHSGLDLTSADSPIWMEHLPFDKAAEFALQNHQIIVSPRVGVAYAEECAKWPWRFRIKNNPWTSSAK